MITISGAEKKKLTSICLLVTNIDAPSGGIQKNSRILLGELNRLGIRTFVCARNYHKLARDEVVNGTHYHRSPVIGSSMFLNSFSYLIDGLIWLIRHRHEYDVIHCQQMYAPAMIAALAKFVVRKPIVVRITSSGDLGEAKNIRQMPLAGLRLKLLSRVDRFVTLTAEMFAEIKALGIAPDKILTINNATEIPPEAAFEIHTRLKYRRKLNLDYEKVAVFIGRLSEEKGIDVLINAWKRVLPVHPSAHLLILGEGGAFRNVEHQMRTLTALLGLNEHVHFLGHVPNVNEYLLASDVFILPSRVEGMSNSLVEAFASGAAIVATDIPANREICVAGTNSLLFGVGEVDQLAENIIRIFENQQLAVALGERARVFAEKNLSSEAMASRYVGLYRSLCSPGLGRDGNQDLSHKSEK